MSDLRRGADGARPRVCFVVGNTNAGVGGQFWDLRTVVEALRPRIDPFIVNVGLSPSKVVNQTDARSFHLEFRGENLLSTLVRMRRIIRAERPDVVHLFDNRVFAFARYASLVSGGPLVFTKCGGENPRGYYPLVRDVVVVSRENERFFRETPRFSGVTTHFLPNRVQAPVPDADRIVELRRRLQGDGPAFLTIARLATPYHGHLLKAIHLVERLHQDGIRCRLGIIGWPQDADVVSAVRARSNDHIRVFSEPYFTQDPNRLIDAADLVIGMGRGVMEAAARGKPLLTQVRESETPVLMRPDNFEALFATNFSPRNSIPDLDPADEYRRVQRAATEPEFQRRLGTWSREVFDRWFNVESVVDEYVELYRTCVVDPRLRLGNFLLGLAYSAKVFRRERRAASGDDRARGS